MNARGEETPTGGPDRPETGPRWPQSSSTQNATRRSSPPRSHAPHSASPKATTALTLAGHERGLTLLVVVCLAHRDAASGRVLDGPPGDRSALRPVGQVD